MLTPKDRDGILACMFYLVFSVNSTEKNWVG